MTACTAEPLFLDEDECFAVLAQDSVGRVNFTRHVMPASVAVRYVVRGRELLLRPDPRSRLARVLDGAVVSFQVDVADPAHDTELRVVLVGTATRATDGAVRLQLHDLTGHRLPAPRRAG